jgi:methyl-accepting chemotaxis protein
LLSDIAQRILFAMSKDDVSKDTELILAEVRGVSGAVTSLTRHVDRMGERLDHMDERLGRVESNVSEIKADVAVIKNAVSEISVDVDDHEHRIKRLEGHAAL